MIRGNLKWLMPSFSELRNVIAHSSEPGMASGPSHFPPCWLSCLLINDFSHKTIVISASSDGLGAQKIIMFQQDYKAFRCLCFPRHYHFINGHYANPLLMAFSVRHMHDHVTIGWILHSHPYTHKNFWQIANELMLELQSGLLSFVHSQFPHQPICARNRATAEHAGWDSFSIYTFCLQRPLEKPVPN